jgi:hypothetical protein
MDWENLIHSAWANKIMPFLASKFSLLVRLIVGWVMAHITYVDFMHLLNSGNTASFQDWLTTSLSALATAIIGWLSLWISNHQKEGVAAIQNMLNQALRNPVITALLPDSLKLLLPANNQIPETGFAGNKTVAVTAALANAATPDNVAIVIPTDPKTV